MRSSSTHGYSVGFPGFSKQLLKNSFTLSLCLGLSGCQIGYIVKSGYNQFDLLWSREEIAKIQSEKKYDDEIRRKLQLATDAKVFAEQELHLKKTGNYSSYVHLDRKYVTWVVTAAEKHSLTKHQWWFPIIGSVPYKGYFDKAGALEEQEAMQKEGYDTWVRGVRAYSTLGWFTDPMLSSMLSYKDHDLVDVVIHELVHTTLYIKSSSEFNEQLAVYFALSGTKKFFKQRNQLEVVKQIDQEYADQILFSKFISAEMEKLKSWYETQASPPTEQQRQHRFDQIRNSYVSDLKPKLNSNLYDWFETAKLNNARLMAMGTYMKDLSFFAQAFTRLNGDFKGYLDKMREFEDSDDPLLALKTWLK